MFNRILVSVSLVFLVALSAPTAAQAAGRYYCPPVAYCVPCPPPPCLPQCLVTDPVHTSYVSLFKATPEGLAESVGTVVFMDTPVGLRIDVDLAGLPPGEHGFHVHEKPNCGAKATDGAAGPGMGAGGHYDPDKTGKHLGPDGGGHKGDLPRLVVAPDGTAKTTLWVKNLTAWEIKYRSLMLHAGGDNYSDQPAALGGGGARIACGIIM